MIKARDDLAAILDLLAEWREENNVGYVTMHIGGDGAGLAYGGGVDVGLRYYKPMDVETPGAVTPGELG